MTKSLLKACISRSAMAGNVRLLMNRTGGVSLCAVVKANAYGHGTKHAVRALSGLGVAFWGVAGLDEALALREMDEAKPVLMLQPVGAYEPDGAFRERVRLMARHGMRATVADGRGLELLAEHASAGGAKICVHIKVDTGMGRSGCPHEEAAGLVVKAVRTPGIVVEGLYSHLACADEPDLRFAREQIALFRAVTGSLESKGVHIPIKHTANSAAVFNLPDSWMNMVRPGLALYGYGAEHVRGSENLTPALKLVAPVIFTKWIKKGGACGYGATFVAKRDTRTGLLPVGYANGYSRRLSNAGLVEVEGRLVPVIGRVSMDLTVIDLTDVPAAGVGTQACIISNDRAAPHSVESMARELGTIPYEIVSALGDRVDRIMVD